MSENQGTLNASSSGGVATKVVSVDERISGVDIAIFLLLMVFLLCSSFSIALTQIGYFSALTVWVGKMIYRREFSLPRTKIDMFVIAYVVAEALATVFAYNKGQSLLY
ncbi:MAG: hypothetical protein HY708_05210, partial [Ignavibacteriae bacterium]|nr:hypothetical protein [Ignavibacteriota bacterium]